MSLRALLPWVPHYAKAFGLARGLATWLRVAWIEGVGSSEPRALRLPGVPHPVWLRAAARDVAIMQQVWVKREYDLRETPHFERLQAFYQEELAAGRTPLVIDAGAHVGMSVLWWRHLFPRALIVAVEPSVENLAVLRRNVGQDPGIAVLHGGIWDRACHLRIEDPDTGASAFRVVETDDPAALRAYTIPGIMAAHGAARCLLVKIDIEGGEAALFRSNLGWMPSAAALAVELHDWLLPWEGSSRALLGALAEHGFECVLSGENLFCFRDPATLA